MSEWTFNCICRHSPHWDRGQIRVELPGVTTDEGFWERANVIMKNHGWYPGAHDCEQHTPKCGPFYYCSKSCVWLREETSKLTAISFATGYYDYEEDAKLQVEHATRYQAEMLARKERT